MRLILTITALLVAMMSFDIPVMSDVQAAGGNCRWEGGPGYSDPDGDGNYQNKSCRREDCKEDDGEALCEAPKIAVVPGETDADGWKYSTCPYAPTGNPENAFWCEGNGGTWDPVTTSCAGLSGDITMWGAVSSSLLDSATDAYAAKKGLGIQSGDTGWGQTDTVCTVAPASTGGFLYRDAKVRSYISPPPDSVTRGVRMKRTRSQECNEGLKQRTRSTSATRAPGEFECYQPAKPCCKTFGNPTDGFHRAKLETAIDYRSGGVGGLEFVRYYNSQGYFAPVAYGAQPVTTDDYWRHTYSAQLYPLPTEPAILAVLQNPDGSLVYFDEAGNEMTAFTARGYKLVFSAGVGYTLTRPNKTVETYDLGGRLHTITDPAGLAITLTYDTQYRLATVTDAFGKALQLGYDANNRLFTLTLPGGTKQFKYEYDSNGMLETVTDPDLAVRINHYDNDNFWLLAGISYEVSTGVYERYSYFAYDLNDKGYVRETKHAGDVLKYTFAVTEPSNASQRQVEVTDPSGNERIYLYDETSQDLGVFLPTTINGAGQCADCGPYQEKRYDADGFIAWAKDWKGNRTSFVYDKTRNLETSRTEGLNSSGGTTADTRTIATTWHSTFRLPATITEPSGVTGVNRVTTYTYNSGGNQLTKTVTAGSQSRQWSWTYDSVGRMLTENGPRTDVTDVTTYAYYPDTDSCVNCRGQLHTVTNALNHVTTYNDYDADGRVKQVTDPNGVVTTYTYNFRGQPLTVSENAGAQGIRTAVYTYWLNGLLKTATQPTGLVLTYNYDAAQLLTRVTDNEGNYIDYGHDAWGNITTEDTRNASNALARAIESTYNTLNQLQSVTVGSTVPSTTMYAYDANGNPDDTTDPRLYVTSRNYDYLDRLKLVDHPQAQGGDTVYAYDQQDQITAVTSPNGAGTGYGYDGLGDVVWESSPDRGITIYAHDAAGNMTCKADGRYVTATTQACGSTSGRSQYTYDALNRLTAITFPDSPDLNQTLTWDPWGQAGALFSLAYANRPDYTWLAHDNFMNRTVQWDYINNGTGNVESLLTNYTYTNGTLLDTITYPKPHPGSANRWVVDYSRDALGRITGITATFGTTTETIVSDVEYKPFGPVASVTYGNDVKQVWDYDDAYRIDAWHIEKSDTSVLESWNYTLDASGNITDRTVNSASTTYAYDAMDRLTQDGFLNYTYDGNGNLNHQYLYLAYQTNSNRIATYWGTTINYDGMGNQLNKGTGVNFTYDAAGRLKTLSEGTQTLLNLYNGMGQRNYTRRALSSTESYVEFFTYAPDGRFLTYISSAQTYGTNGQPNGLGIREAVHYIWLDQTPVAQIRERYYANGTHWDTQLVYLHADQLNTPRRATNYTESIVWKANSYAYGLTTEVPDPDGDNEDTWVALRFPGQMAYNAGYQFNYNYYRDYDAVTGRYLESDPIGLGGGINTFGYALGNPMTYVDPTGLLAMPDYSLSFEFWFGGGAAQELINSCDYFMSDPKVRAAINQIKRKVDTKVQSLADQGFVGTTSFAFSKSGALDLTQDVHLQNHIYSFGAGEYRTQSANCVATGDGCCVTGNCDLIATARDKFEDPVNLCQELGICGGIQNLGGKPFWFSIECHESYSVTKCKK